MITGKTILIALGCIAFLALTTISLSLMLKKKTHDKKELEPAVSVDKSPKSNTHGVLVAPKTEFVLQNRNRKDSDELPVSTNEGRNNENPSEENKLEESWENLKGIELIKFAKTRFNEMGNEKCLAFL